MWGQDCDVMHLGVAGVGDSLHPAPKGPHSMAQHPNFYQSNISKRPIRCWPWNAMGSANQAPSPSNPESEAHIPKETSGPSAREFGPEASGDGTA